MTDREFVASVLADGLPHSQAEILRRSFTERGCGLTVHSRVADLRARDFIIVCDRRPHADRGERYVYTLLAEPSLSTAPVSPLDARSPLGASGQRIGIGAAESEAAPSPASARADAGRTSSPSTSLSSEGVASLEDRRGDLTRLPSRAAVAPATLFEDDPEPRKPVWA